MPYANVVGRSRRSPATPVMTARRSASTWPARPAGGAGPAVAGPVRPVRGLRHRPAGRGPALVGSDPVRRAGGPGVRAVVSEPDPQHPGAGSAAGVPGLPNGHRAPNAVIEHPPAMKLNGTGWNCPIHPNPGVGVRPRTCWSGHWPLQQVAGSVVAVRGSASSRRRARPRQPWPGRGVSGVAVRPGWPPPWWPAPGMRRAEALLRQPLRAPVATGERSDRSTASASVRPVEHFLLRRCRPPTGPATPDPSSRQRRYLDQVP